MAYTEPTIVVGNRQPAKIIRATGPTVRVATPKWQRDPGISDLIDYFDDPRFLDCKSNDERLAKLTVREINEITKITKRCREDFPFASRNFFWIADKARGDRLLSLWESQQLVYEHICRLKSMGIAQKVFCLKARQLGVSTLIEAMIAWRTMFFRNVNAIIVSYNPRHAGELLGMILHIKDQMPWWLMPMESARENQDGITFANPDPEQRRDNPGLKSRIKAEGSNKRTGVGQGLSINCAHLSEISDYDQKDARGVIEEDLGNALADTPETFAVIETTAKGVGNYTYDFWNKCVELEEDGQAEWYPLFLPFFFERTRVLAPENGWRPESKEVEMQERVEKDWTRCDNEDCGQYRERFKRLKDCDGAICPTCGVGTLKVYSLSDAQMRWMQKRRKNSEKDAESLKKLHQEMAFTPESAFQLSGTPVFGTGSQEFVNNTIKPPIKRGFLDLKGKMHGCDQYNRKINSATGDYYEACYLTDCDQDHAFGDENNENPLQLWEEPIDGRVYCIGADVSEGLGAKHDSSVAAILKISKNGHEPDEQVGVFRTNLIDPITFARVLNHLGRWYNDCLMSVEMNRYDTAHTQLLTFYQYPNMYRWKNDDSVNQISSRFGWRTTPASKPRLYLTMKSRLQHKLILIYDRVFALEMKTFTKDAEDARNASSEGSTHDDSAISMMIALYTAHEYEWDENLGQMGIRKPPTREDSNWWMRCRGCNLEWYTNTCDESKKCPRCSCMVIEGTRNQLASSENSSGQSDPFYRSKEEGGIRMNNVFEMGQEADRKREEDDIRADAFGSDSPEFRYESL